MYIYVPKYINVPYSVFFNITCVYVLMVDGLVLNNQLVFFYLGNTISLGLSVV